ncbi:MAG: hypothetical protein UT66_C0030G0004 [candidate division CPR2 bacterium GW2011_GWC1_39_9]|uniref:DUF5667 domain-containing protein n=1 Tax=candidate division CPR2 bacterium GW2011_GWC2_39_10 TaxID=1618345 RepID=A0A0G0M020_UNCC2|nr:MAG: hypothetical protein UT18_C0017G0005 [candidate division CPR2 bacterium GW2011_GWC2_39_10]KKR34038.1 MAG: hypothetical protein UT66_C0030G0004 [candidate division CPR2 bacterium GW2011_GWC1_39_9]
MKKYLISTSLIVLVALPTATLANTPGDSSLKRVVTTTPTPTVRRTTITPVPPMPRIDDATFKKDTEDAFKEYRTATGQTKKIESLKKAAQKATDHRIDVLNQLIENVDANTRLSDADKATIKDGINTQITALTDLNTEIQAATDLTTIKPLVKKLYDYKIITVMKPKQIGIMAVARIQGVTNRLENLEKKIERLLAKAKADGADVDAIEASLATFNEKIAEAKSYAAQAKEIFKSISASDPEQAKVLREEGKADLQKARESLKAASTELHKIIVALKTANNPTLTPSVTPETSPEATPTATPTPEV